MRSKKRQSISEIIERLLTTGSAAAVVSLGVAAGLVVILGAAIATFGHIHATDGDLSFVNAIWQVLQRTIDPGQLGGERSWISRVFLLIITLVGLLLISTLISIVNSTIERRIEAARRGRRHVQARDHVVILGWNNLGTKYTEELAEAYEDTSLQHVVILADEDPIELVRSIQDDLLERRTLRPTWSILGAKDDGRDKSIIRRPDQWVTVRRGDPTDTRDLLTLARVAEARSVIVVSPSGSDAETTQYVLSVLAALQVKSYGVRRTEPLPVVASFDSSALATRLAARIARLCDSLADSGFQRITLHPVTPDLVRTGIAAQVAPHRGLSSVYRDLLNFDDSELYLVNANEDSRVFGEIALARGATVLGLLDASTVRLWPSWSMPISGCAVIVLAATEDDAARCLTGPASTSLAGRVRRGRTPNADPERFLIVGWNADAEHLIASIRMRHRGARFTVLLDELDRGPDDAHCDVRRRVTGALDDPLDDVTFVHEFDHALVLAHDELDDSESDARVLADVLACRVQAHDDARGRPLTVVAEFRQRSIKHVAGAGARLADDLLVNDSLAASATVQLAINPRIEPILRELLVGSESGTTFIPLNESETAHLVGQPWSVVRAALAQANGELGVAIRSGGADPHVTVNPSCDQVLLADDEVIVLSRIGDPAE